MYSISLLSSISFDKTKNEMFAYRFGINGVELPPGITARRLFQPPEKNTSNIKFNIRQEL